MSMRETLIKAKALIDTPETWCQNAFAMDKDGNLVATNDPRAVCRCTLGAVGSVLGLPLGNSAEVILDLPPEYVRLLDDAAVVVAKAHTKPEDQTYIESMQIIEINDDEAGLNIPAHEAVMKALDIAIERAPHHEPAIVS